MKRSFIIFSLFFCSSLLFTLNLHSQQSFFEEIKSPQSSDFMRCANTTISKNTGRLEFSIPLLNIVEKDFNLPVSISYNSAGFMPAKNEGIVGLNWFINAGGCITRSVNGMMADDHRIAPENFYSRRGLSFIPKGMYSEDDVSLFRKEKFHYDPYGFYLTSGMIDPNPDVFSFNFCGYSGKFIIGYDGNPKVISSTQGSFQVILHSFNEQTRLGYCPEPTMIIIKADNGYTYYFGSLHVTSPAALEYNVDFSRGDVVFEEILTPGPITAFYLTKIIAPNQMELNIAYELLPYSDRFNMETFPKQKQNFVFNKYTSASYLSKAEPNPHGQLTEFSGLSDSYSVTKIARISAITTENQEALFFYSGKKSMYAGESKWPVYSDCGSKLDSIVLRVNPEYYSDIEDPVRNRIAFQYSYRGGEFSRLFLDALLLNNTEKYWFSYHKTLLLPNPNTGGVDHWNYWSRMSTYFGQLLPDFRINQNGEYIYLSTVREVTSEALFDATLLQKVTFPTGGTMEVEYEEHDYSKRLDQTAYSNYFPALLDREGFAGGARVKTILENDGKIVMRRGFEYLDNEGKSSGVLMNWPQYFQPQYVALPGGMMGYYPGAYTYTTSAFNLDAYDSDHVRYSRVKETQVEEAISVVKKEYNFGLSSIAGGETEGIHNTNFTLSKPARAAFSARISTIASGKSCTLIIYRNRQMFKRFQLDTNRTSIPDTLMVLPEGKYEVGFQISPATGFTSRIYLFDTPAVYKGPYTISYFSDYSTNPDTINETTNCGERLEIRQMYTNKLGKTSDLSFQRGKLLKKQEFNSQGILIEEVDYEYEENVQCRKIGYGIKTLMESPPYDIPETPAPIVQVYSIPLAPYNLVKQIKTTYSKDGNYPIIETISYWYDSHNLLKEQSVKIGNESYTTKYLHAVDKAADFPYEEMKTEFILNPEVEVQQYKNDFLQKTYRINYAQWMPDIPSPCRDRRSYIHYLPASLEIQMGSNISEEREVCHLYDKEGNRVYVTRDGHKKVVYLWGYNYQYIIAEVVNASYEQVENALGCRPESLSCQTVPDWEKIGRLRAQLPDAKVATYTYIPLVGIQSYTDAAGLTSHYVYDHMNRLTEVYRIKDGVKQILEAYQYHYQEQ